MIELHSKLLKLKDYTHQSDMFVSVFVCFKQNPVSSANNRFNWPHKISADQHDLVGKKQPKAREWHLIPEYSKTFVMSDESYR